MPTEDYQDSSILHFLGRQHFIFTVHCVFTVILAHIRYKEIHNQLSIVHLTYSEPSLYTAILFINRRLDRITLGINSTPITSWTLIWLQMLGPLVIKSLKPRCSITSLQLTFCHSERVTLFFSVRNNKWLCLVFFFSRLCTTDCLATIGMSS